MLAERSLGRHAKSLEIASTPPADARPLCRRCDRPRRSLRHGETERSHDRDADRSRAIAGKTAGTVLVDHNVGRPLQPLAGLHHCVSQRENLLAIERARRACRQKRRQVDVGIFPVHDVLNDGVERGLAEIVAVDAAADVTERIERPRMHHGDAVALFHAKPKPGGLGQSRLIVRDEIAGRLVERGDRGLRSMASSGGAESG